VPGTLLDAQQCEPVCKILAPCSVYDVDSAGNIIVQCGAGCTGRKPAGLAPAREAAPPASPVGAYFADCARLEAASVAAFQVLAAELTAHGAPRDLVTRAERAARDEVKHSRVVGALAARFGADVQEAAVKPPETRPLEEIARENAVEGCVRETFGALLASLQGRDAKDRTVGAVLRRIARDEVRHAALAWAVAEWADSKLDERARARIRAARVDAIGELRRAMVAEPNEALASVAGYPRAARARAMLDAMEAALWV
jgi:hypothetical protein